MPARDCSDRNVIRGFLSLILLWLLISQIAAAKTVSSVPHFRVLYTFTGAADGGNPISGVVLDGAGNLYGTTYLGGDPFCNCGTVFRVAKNGAQMVLFTFTGDQDFGGPDGSWPADDIIFDQSGNLYGTTTGGGTGRGAPFDGVVFKLDSLGEESVLHAFTGSDPRTHDGAGPFSGLIRDAAGNLFGTTPVGGTAGDGTIFKVDPSGNESVLHDFTGGADGLSPYGDLVQDASGNLYGAAPYGAISGNGTIYKLDTLGHFTVLYSFVGGPKDGSHPFARLLLDGTGNLFGTTMDGGGSNNGVVFKIDTSGRESVLYSFSGGPDGGKPVGGMVQDPAGNLYGTTTSGGDLMCESIGCGVLFKLDTSGKETVLHMFTGGPDGAVPDFVNLVRDVRGTLYGTTTYGGRGFGVVFQF